MDVKSLFKYEKINLVSEGFLWISLCDMTCVPASLVGTHFKRDADIYWYKTVLHLIELFFSVKLLLT